MTTLRAGAATDVGRVRSNNQDHLLMADPLFAVADGMGGHAGGEVASLAAVEALKATYERNPSADGLADAVRKANEVVWNRAQEARELRGMGTTITAVALVEGDEDDLLAVVNVGDSRAYLLRDGDLEQLTDDHSVPEELRRAGRRGDAEAASLTAPSPPSARASCPSPPRGHRRGRRGERRGRRTRTGSRRPAGSRRS